jgi:DNA repair protein RAD7
LQQRSGYDSDDLDEPEEATPATKKRKLTKAAQEKLKAKEKANAKKKGKKGGDDDGPQDGEEDPYTALSKSAWGGATVKPPVGNFEKCAKCEKEFTVVRGFVYEYHFLS